MFFLKKLIRLLCSNDNKRIQLIDLIETHAYRTSKHLVRVKKRLNVTI